MLLRFQPQKEKVSVEFCLRPGLVSPSPLSDIEILESHTISIDSVFSDNRRRAEHFNAMNRFILRYIY